MIEHDLGDGAAMTGLPSCVPDLLFRVGLHHAVGDDRAAMLGAGPDEAENARLRWSSPSASVRVMSPKANVPSVDQRTIRPMIMPKSPTRLTMNALLAAVEAVLRSI